MNAKVTCRSMEEREQPRCREVVGLQDGAKLRLGALLGDQQPIPVAGQRPQLRQQRAAGWQRPPMGVLVAQGVGQHERVEHVVLAAGSPVALPGAGRDPRTDRIDPMPAGLQVLHQQPLGPLHRDRQPGPKPAELLVEPGQPATPWASRT